MRPYYFLSLLLLFVLPAKSQSSLEGTYKGKFKVVYSQDNSMHQGKVTLTLKENTYTCSANKNRIPAGGSGSFSIKHDKIVFEDENMWTADFDWNLILKGEYSFTVKGKSMLIVAHRENGIYEYRLTRK